MKKLEGHIKQEWEMYKQYCRGKTRPKFWLSHCKIGEGDDNVEQLSIRVPPDHRFQKIASHW